MDAVERALKSFLPNAELVKYERYGCGHINDTYKVDCKSDGAPISYILQKINNKVFPDVEALMGNMLAVTDFIKERIASTGGNVANTISLFRVATGEGKGKPYYVDPDGGHYRLMTFIKEGYSVEGAPTDEAMFLAGKGFGQFQKLLNGFPAEQLREPIPNFHNTKMRLATFIKAVEADKVGRANEVRTEVDFFLRRKDYAGRIVDLMSCGKMPTRVTHNDTKINNILLDLDRKVAVTAVDLDTVMPGSVVYDFGDSIRSGANLGLEDEKDLVKVGFSLARFEAYAKGFLSEVKGTLTPVEVENLAFGAILMTFECGMRFLTDYLSGDVYFKIKRPEHNLDRCRTQMKMVSDMEHSLADMNAVVKKYAKIS